VRDEALITANAASEEYARLLAEVARHDMER
jgi:hypothetical protein